MFGWQTFSGTSLLGTQSFDGIKVCSLSGRLISKTDPYQAEKKTASATEPRLTTVFQFAKLETTVDAAIPRIIPVHPPIRGLPPRRDSRERDEFRGRRISL